MNLDFDHMVDRRHTASQKWDTFDEDVLPFTVAEMDFSPPQPVLQALLERVDHGMFGYGLEPPGLREVFVERLESLYDWRISTKALVFLSAINPSFNLACRAVTSPGDGGLVQTPVYPPILFAPGNANLACNEMQLTRQSDGRYTIDFDAFEAAITDRTRIFVLCNPHNPVGRVFQRDELERMAEICLRHDIIICSDEIHCDLVFSGSRHIPIASLDPEVADRTITLMGPGKGFNIGGLRSSVVVVENAELRERLVASRAGLIPGINVMEYIAALAAYRDGQPWLDAVLPYLEANRDYVFEYVKAHLPGITMGKPEGTYLAWLDCRRAGIPGDPHEFFLQKARVALLPGEGYGRGSEGFVRLNFASPRVLLEKGLGRMKEALAAL